MQISSWFFSYIGSFAQGQFGTVRGNLQGNYGTIKDFGLYAGVTVALQSLGENGVAVGEASPRLLDRANFWGYPLFFDPPVPPPPYPSLNVTKYSVSP